MFTINRSTASRKFQRWRKTFSIFSTLQQLWDASQTDIAEKDEEGNSIDQDEPDIGGEITPQSSEIMKPPQQPKKRPNNHTHFQHRLPPYPCSICTEQEILNAYHWKLQCPFNQHQFRQTPFNCDSSLATNTVSQSSENSVSSQQTPNQRQHPFTEASCPAYWQLQVSGHISLLPSLANFDNLPKQNNVNIVIDNGSTLSLISADIVKKLRLQKQTTRRIHIN
ncbi:uncharacterized protein TNCV_1525401 [Trichonephila clavipes]|nr:uncharacterized protein TNCV_1525401 [Trichonephila clavipes]